MSSTVETKPITTSENGTKPVVVGGADQTFLVGDSLYLRALETDDAKRASAWRFSPFPVSAERAEESIKEDVPQARKERTWTLVACRRSDDLQVGAVTFSMPWTYPSAWVAIKIDPVFGPAKGAMEAELLKLIVPYLHRERECWSVEFEVDAHQAELIAAAAQVGARPSAILREAIWRDGARRDQHHFQALNPRWMAIFGDPGTGLDYAVGPDDPQRWRKGAPRPVTAEFEGDPPKNAVLVGPRIYIRPIEADDAQQDAYWSRRETETFFDDGRRPRSSVAQAAWHKDLTKNEPPGWIRFAVCLRENDEYIGSNGIADIDWVHKTAETESFFHRADYRGNGYGTEAKHLLLAYAFEQLGLHQVRSFVWGPNTRSAAALRKQGYRDAGRFFWDGSKDGVMTFATTFDLLASEWRQMQGR